MDRESYICVANHMNYHGDMRTRGGLRDQQIRRGRRNYPGRDHVDRFLRGRGYRPGVFFLCDGGVRKKDRNPLELTERLQLRSGHAEDHTSFI